MVWFIKTILHCCHENASVISKWIEGPAYPWFYNPLLPKSPKRADFIKILCALEQQDGKASFYVKHFRDFNNSRGEHTHMSVQTSSHSTPRTECTAFHVCHTVGSCADVPPKAIDGIVSNVFKLHINDIMLQVWWWKLLFLFNVLLLDIYSY